MPAYHRERHSERDRCIVLTKIRTWKVLKEAIGRKLAASEEARGRKLEIVQFLEGCISDDLGFEVYEFLKSTRCI